MPVSHTIKARLYENLLTKNHPEDYIARTISENSLNVRQICEAAVSRGGAEISASAMEHAASLFLKEMAYQLCDGYAVNTGYFTAGTRIRGLFSGTADTYDPARHSILFNFSQGEKLRAQIPDIGVSILGMAHSGSAILHVTDVKSGSVNHIITPGRNLKIQGKGLKIAGESTQNGIFSIDAVSNSRIAVETKDIVFNSPSELIIIIPNLQSGAYHLEVVSQYSRSAILKLPRTARLLHTITVE